MDPPVISAQHLCDIKACDEGLVRFRQTFGDQTTIDPNTLDKWTDFHDVDWAILKLLNRDGQRIYHKHMTPHRPDYYAARDRAIKDYGDAIDAAYASHDPEDGVSVARYHDEWDRAFATYQQRMSELDSSLRPKMAEAFVRGFREQKRD